ncbi:Synaptic vesicle glycoprotein 2B [Nibea albiflora]|uniref:Synaptic vesicle glycoprotein 2B n=1 Tax=Nibea albiflora TaxID=240163 RepID=A0ACB7FGV9_NIBAL|nr:Synaptic vesicle glycoprotein 2B [Nibea albiflora]
MPRHVHGGDAEVREPLLTEDCPEPSELDSDEGEIIFERRAANVTRGAGVGEKRRLTYEEAVDETGFGLFHWLLLVVCGWANASDAVEILCVSFLLPTARCDLLLSSSDMGLLTASIFLGMMVGGYLWGYLADQRGRRRILVVSLTVNGVFGGLASVAPWFWLFLLLRFISGIGVGGSIPVIFSYFSEFMPRLRRGAMISALATFWMAGNILAAGLAWLVIPRTWARFSLGPLDFQSWRLFVVLCSVPSLTSAILFRLLMPESPKFLMEAAQEKEATHVFRLMFELNMWGKGKEFPDFGLCTGSKQRAELEESRPHRGPHRGRPSRVWMIFKKGLVPIKQMFKGPLRSRSIILLVVFFCISFGRQWQITTEDVLSSATRNHEVCVSVCVCVHVCSYYGLWMWFPELFDRIEEGGSPCANVSLPSPQHNQSCYPVKTAACSLLASSLSVFLIYVVQTKVQSLILSCVFSGVSVIAWNALDVVGTELYPTQLRSSALGFFTGVARVAAIMGNVVFGKLVDTNCAVPVLLVSALLLTGGLVALLLPQTRQTELT